MTYFDAVLTRDYIPVFNGTREETKEYLKNHTAFNFHENHQVCVGETLEVMPVVQYLSRKDL